MPPRPDAAWAPPPVRPLGRIDLYFALAVALASWVVAARALPAFRESGGHAEFYQAEFAPAVMSACSRGYLAPDESSTPPSLAAFLALQADTFD